MINPITPYKMLSKLVWNGLDLTYHFFFFNLLITDSKDSIVLPLNRFISSKILYSAGVLLIPFFTMCCTGNLLRLLFMFNSSMLRDNF